MLQAALKILHKAAIITATRNAAARVTNLYKSNPADPSDATDYD